MSNEKIEVIKEIGRIKVVKEVKEVPVKVCIPIEDFDWLTKTACKYGRSKYMFATENRSNKMREEAGLSKDIGKSRFE